MERKIGSTISVNPSLKAAISSLLLALAVTCLSKGSQVSAKSPLDEKGIQITHKIASDAILNCTVKDLGTRRIIWSKLSDPYPIAVGNTRFIPNKKYKIDVTTDSSILTIKNIKLEDAGEYLCRVSGQVYLAETITLIFQTADKVNNTYLLTSATEILADTGSTVVLPCHVENLKDNLVLWKNSKGDVLSLRKKDYSGDRRLNVVHNTRTEWSLQIKNVRKSDFGLFTCIINSEPILTRTVQLRNKTPSTFSPLLIQDNSYKKQVTVPRGETVTLACNFKANPPANVTWQRRREGYTELEELGTGSSYTLRAASPEQSGQYFCVGRNGLEPDGRGKTRLIVLAPPTAAPVLETTRISPTGPISPFMYHEKERVRQRKGENVDLKCTAIGFPRPVIHWLKNGIRLADNYKYKMTEEIYRNDTLHSVLRVRSLTDRDFGEFHCSGSNTLGRSQITFHVDLLN